MRFRKIRGSIHGIRGLRLAWGEEASFRIEMFWGTLAVALSWFFGISAVEWLLVAAMIGFIFAAEIFNTALEEICDMVTLEHDPHIGKIKDLSAAAVLVSWITAFVVGCIIFIPYFLAYL